MNPRDEAEERAVGSTRGGFSDAAVSERYVEGVRMETPELASLPRHMIPGCHGRAGCAPSRPVSPDAAGWRRPGAGCVREARTWGHQAVPSTPWNAAVVW